MRSECKVDGEFPEEVYRFFDKEEYAIDFVENGKFRLGSLKTYKANKCASRRDETEGHAYNRMIQDKRTRNIYLSYAGHAFLLCFSTLDADFYRMKKEIGPYVVKVYSPIALALDIDKAVNQKTVNRKYAIFGSKVEYGSGSYIHDKLSPKKSAELSLTQKPIKHKWQSEYRLCLMKLNPKPISKYKYIDLGGPVEYSEIINC